MTTNIKKDILKALDGKEGRVSAGIAIEGSLEGECKFEYNENFGLFILVPVRWNNNKIADPILQVIVEQNLRPSSEETKVSWDAREELIKSIEKITKDFWVQAACIYPYSITKIEVSVDDKDKIRQCIITYPNNIIKLQIIK